MPKFKKAYFKRPGCEYSPGYFWVINGKLDVKLMCRQLDDMAAHGIRAVCLHPFPKEFRPQTMPSEASPAYMSGDFMKIVAKVMEYAEKLGMNAWLYDEGGWPSGGCCGQVSQANPEKYAIRTKVLDEDGVVKDIINFGDPAFAAPYVSVIEDGTTDKFIELTHEKWRKYCGKRFGKTIKFTFTDEPNMNQFIIGKQMTWCADFPEYFRKLKGYDITPFIPTILADRKLNSTEKQMRIDYCDARAQIFQDRFLIPVKEWCRRNKLLSGGHLNGEDEPVGNRIYGYGHILRSLRNLDVPGVDVIWRQLYPTNETNMPFPLYAASAAHQIGSKYALSESLGIFGDNTTPSMFKWLIDYQLVRGINVFVLAYYMYYCGKNHTVSFAPNLNCSSVWDFMAPFYNYAARVGSMLGNGKPCAKTAVLYDIHAIWAGGKDADLAIAKHLEVAQKMLRNQQDFDFIDDEQLAAAKVYEDGTIKIGKMVYDTIVLPTYKYMTEDAIEALEEFDAHGGLILGADGVCHAPRTCKVHGKGKENIRVAKRVFDDGKAVYFFTNESATETVNAQIELDEEANVVLCDTATGKFQNIGSSDGKFQWTLEPYTSALFMTGLEGEEDIPRFRSGKSISIDAGWKMARIAEYGPGEEELEIHQVKENAIATELGDWRAKYPGKFTGKVRYTVSFDSPKASHALLDLGKVNFCADVTLNGRKLDLKFFGPFRYNVWLKKGENRLEVVVANTMANILGDQETRSRLNAKFPPKSCYDRYIDNFNQDDQDSGLFGPVKVTLLKKAKA